MKTMKLKQQGEQESTNVSYFDEREEVRFAHNKGAHGEMASPAVKANEPKVAKNQVVPTSAAAKEQVPLRPVESSLNARGDRALRRVSADETSEERRKAPNWSRFVGTKGDFLNKQDQEVINQYEKQPDETVQELLDTEKNGEQYAATLFKAMRNITETKVTEYVLELLEEFLAPDVSGRMVYFETDGKLPDLTPLVRNLESDSAFVRDKASSILALFLSTHADKEAEAVDGYMTWCVEQLRHHKNNANHSSLKAAVFSLTVSLANPICRLSFRKHGGVKLIQVYLNNASSKNTQFVYEVALCLWEASLTPECVKEIGFQCVLDLCQLVADNRKEKIVRVALATLRAVVTSQPDKKQELGEWVSAADLQKTLEQMHMARITDPDIVNDVEALRQALAHNFRELTNFEVFRHELNSGKLKVGAAHEEKFWRENVKATEAENFKVVRDLIALLEKPKEDPEDLTLAIACSDLGYFCQFYPTGRTILQTLGAKPRVMALMEHKDRDVQKAALVCISKMLVMQWEFLNITTS